MPARNGIRLLALNEFSDATEAHGSGFLLGKISGVLLSADEADQKRWLITISEFARINYPNLWDHWRNPVRYASFEELGISLDGVEFQPMPSSSEPLHQSEPGSGFPPMLTIPEAKKALAATFGVKPEAVEITIRG